MTTLVADTLGATPSDTVPMLSLINGARSGFAVVTYVGGVSEFTSSFNHTGITDEGVGSSTINMTNPFFTSTYLVQASPSNDSVDTGSQSKIAAYRRLGGSYYVSISSTNGTNDDRPYSVAVTGVEVS